jgi:RNA polymerase sigma-70 factor, ECF subfamily
MRKISEYTDDELLTLLFGSKAESEVAFTEIYARYSQKIYVYCHRVMEYNDDANDIFQDTFVKFFETFKNYKNLSNIKGMLVRIARNLCLNYKRDEKDTVEFDEMKMPVYDKSSDDEELVDLMEKAIKLLDFEYREVFILRNYQGLSYQDISEILNISHAAVRNRVARSKEKLREILQPYLEEL